MSGRRLRGSVLLAALMLLQGSDFSCSSGGGSLGPGRLTIQVSGVVRFVQIEGGCWTLRADGGAIYELLTSKATSHILVDGARVSLVVSPREAASSCMLGEIAEVERVQSLQLP
ncbi:MAG TPA: hypothetical protein VFP98_07185 [Candidatus Polarisedimenticolia bacterium]|nr:hypothetical protein [Candidatus Polarisedimenticolia bacterium]